MGLRKPHHSCYLEVIMKTLRSIFSMSLISFLGLTTQPIEAKKPSPLRSALGTLQEWVVEAEANHRTIEALQLDRDENKTIRNTITAYKHFTTIINVLISHYTFFIQQEKAVSSSNKTWKGYKPQVIRFYVEVKNNLITDARIIGTALAHALRTDGISQKNTNLLISIQLALTSLSVWIAQDLGDEETTNSSIMEHVENLVTFKQELEKAPTKRKVSSSLKWRLTRLALKVAVVGFAIYGFDCATGGHLQEALSTVNWSELGSWAWNSMPWNTVTVEAIGEPAVNAAVNATQEVITPTLTETFVDTATQAAQEVIQPAQEILVQAAPVAQQTCFSGWNIFGRIADKIMRRC